MHGELECELVWDAGLSQAPVYLAEVLLAMGK